jgi:hypothetical protein
LANAFVPQELQRIISRCLDLLYSGLDSPSGLLENCDYLLIIKTFEPQIIASRQHWTNLADAAIRANEHGTFISRSMGVRSVLKLVFSCQAGPPNGSNTATIFPNFTSTMQCWSLIRLACKMHWSVRP